MHRSEEIIYEEIKDRLAKLISLDDVFDDETQLKVSTDAEGAVIVHSKVDNIYFGVDDDNQIQAGITVDRSLLPWLVKALADQLDDDEKDELVDHLK